jgi:hypothetical protein
MSEKRYQECNWLGKLWRCRYYLLVPFQWLQWKLFTPKGEFNDKTMWHLLIGMAQGDMKYYWTEEEVDQMLREKYPANIEGSDEFNEANQNKDE